MDCPVRAIVGDPEAGRAALATACRDAVERDGAQSIMLGSMTLGALGLDDQLRRELAVAVINPIQAAVAAALACLQALSPRPA
jgi:Asp/Glu/hydantoin racemase